jgi:hypothetical protein
VPSPQALVSFVVVLFVLLLATRASLGLDPMTSAGVSGALALAFAWIVERRVPPDLDDITEEAERDVTE